MFRLQYETIHVVLVL